MPKVLCVRLNATERRQLELARRRARDPRVWKRATAILMSARGVLASMIARTVGVSLNTVTGYRHRWLKDGLFGLADRPRSGRPRTADSRYLRQLRRAVRTLPRRLGFAFNVWSCGRLAVYLERKTGKRISGAHLATLLRAMNYRFRRPKHTLKGKRNELQHDRAYRKLQRLKKGLSSLPPVSPSGMATAASSTCGRTWLDCGNSAVPNSVSPLPVRIASSRSSGR